MPMKVKAIFFLSWLVSKPDIKNDVNAFLFDQVTSICDSKMYQFQKCTKKI